MSAAHSTAHRLVRPCRPDSCALGGARRVGSGRTGPALHLAQLREALAQHLPRRGRGSVRVQLGGLGRQNTGESQESQQHNLQHAVHRGKHPGCRWWALAYAAPPLVVVAVAMYTPPSTGLSHATTVRAERRRRPSRQTDLAHAMRSDGSDDFVVRGAFRTHFSHLQTGAPARLRWPKRVSDAPCRRARACIRLPTCYRPPPRAGASPNAAVSLNRPTVLDPPLQSERAWPPISCCPPRAAGNKPSGAGTSSPARPARATAAGASHAGRLPPPQPPSPAGLLRS